MGNGSPDASHISVALIDFSLFQLYLRNPDANPTISRLSGVELKENWTDPLNYDKLATAQHSNFLPFAVETTVPTGGISPAAVQLIDQLALASQDYLTLPSPHPFAHNIHSSIAIAIQRGNALAIYAGYSRTIQRVNRGWQGTA